MSPYVRRPSGSCHPVAHSLSVFLPFTSPHLAALSTAGARSIRWPLLNGFYCGLTQKNSFLHSLPACLTGTPYHGEKGRRVATICSRIPKPIAFRDQVTPAASIPEQVFCFIQVSYLTSATLGFVEDNTGANAGKAAGDLTPLCTHIAPCCAVWAVGGRFTPEQCSQRHNLTLPTIGRSRQKLSGLSGRCPVTHMTNSKSALAGASKSIALCTIHKSN